MKLLSAIHRTEQAAAGLFAGLVGIDVSVRQATLLQAIKAAPGASQTALTVMTGIDRSTLAEMIRRLQRKGWVERRRNRTDARAYVVNLTREGMKVLISAQTAAAQAEKELRARIPGVQHLLNGH